MKRQKVPKWKFRRAYAVDLMRSSSGGLYEFYHYDPNVMDDSLPEHLRKYAYDPEFLLPLSGWTPGGRYDPIPQRIKRVLLPKRTALMIYDSEANRPVTHGVAETSYSAISPEFLKRICESRLAANFSRSLDQRARTGRVWIYAIIGVVVLGVILKVTGVF